RLPDEVTFDAEEVMLLKLAGRVWQGESMVHEVSRALTKIRAHGVESPDPVIGIAPRLVLHSQSYPMLQEAIEQSLQVSFLYHKPLSAQAELRTVEPLTLLTFKDHWLLYAFD